MSYTEKGHASACDLFFGKLCSCAVGEVERLKREGSPGVLHEVDQAFRKLELMERDQARREVEILRAEIQQLRMAIQADLLD